MRHRSARQAIKEVTWPLDSHETRDDHRQPPAPVEKQSNDFSNRQSQSPLSRCHCPWNHLRGQRDPANDPDQECEPALNVVVSEKRRPRISRSARVQIARPRGNLVAAPIQKCPCGPDNCNPNQKREHTPNQVHSPLLVIEKPAHGCCLKQQNRGKQHQRHKQGERHLPRITIGQPRPGRCPRE